jgi:hypothetical protein
MSVSSPRVKSSRCRKCLPVLVFVGGVCWCCCCKGCLEERRAQAVAFAVFCAQGVKKKSARRNARAHRRRPPRLSPLPLQQCKAQRHWGRFVSNFHLAGGLPRSCRCTHAPAHSRQQRRSGRTHGPCCWHGAGLPMACYAMWSSWLYRYLQRECDCFAAEGFWSKQKMCNVLLQEANFDCVCGCKRE